MKSKDVIVIGAGVIGLCSAYYLQRAGFHVHVIEREPRERTGCSFGNAGMIVPSHFIPLAAPGMISLGLKWMFNPKSPFRIRPSVSADVIGWGMKFAKAANAEHVRRAAPLLRDLNLKSRGLYADLAAEADDFGLQRRGLLMLCRTHQALEAEAHVVEQAKTLGVPAEVVNPARTAELDPDIRMTIAGGVYFPLDCHLDPARLMASLQRRLESAGVHFSFSTEVKGWRLQGTRISGVETSGGICTAEEFVVAGGAWSPAMVRALGVKIPMLPGKGYSLTLPQPRQRPRLCSILAEARVAVTPMGSSLRVGGTMEIGDFSPTIRRKRVKGIIESIPSYFPDFRTADFKDVPVWSGLRPCSPDGLPYLGRFHPYPNLTVATGHAMMGLSLGPVTGQLVAALLAGQRPSIELSQLSPNRYA